MLADKIWNLNLQSIKLNSLGLQEWNLTGFSALPKEWHLVLGMGKGNGNMLWGQQGLECSVWEVWGSEPSQRKYGREEEFWPRTFLGVTHKVHHSWKIPHYREWYFLVENFNGQRNGCRANNKFDQMASPKNDGEQTRNRRKRYLVSLKKEMTRNKKWLKMWGGKNQLEGDYMISQSFCISSYWRNLSVAYPLTLINSIYWKF